jgi:ABC-2 type transport system permease protein
MRRSHYAILASIAAVVVFAGLNLASWKWLAPARADFTANKLYTLSSSAREVVERLIEPVELEFVYSRSLGSDFPAIRAHADRVRQMMAEIAAYSGGKVKLREIEPEPFSEEEERIAGAGLTPAPTDRGDPLYLGIIGHNTVDDAIAIPFLAPERDALLEYELVRLISQLDDPAPPRIAVISSLTPYQLHPSEPQAAFLLREARRAYDVVVLDPEFRELPPGTDALLIVHPGPLSEWQQYLIDQFLLRKGTALIALDPAARAAAVQQGGLAPIASNLPRMEQMLGVLLAPDVVADRTLALPVNVDAGGGRMIQEGQPLFIAPQPSLMSKSDVITSDLSRPINFGSPGHFTFASRAGLTFEPLITATAGAAFMPAAFAMSDPKPRAVMEAYQPAGQSPVIAGRLSGKLRSTFDRPPQPAPDEDPVLAELQRQAMERAPPFVSASEGSAEIVLVADVDMLDDGFYVHPQTGQALADNAAFVLNALDNLSGDYALTELRSRAPAARPMTRIDDIETAARERLYAEQTRLEKELTDAEARAGELEARRASGVASSEEELAAISEYREKAVAARRQLRAVEREFRRDVDALAGRLAFVNIWLPPMIIGLIGIGVMVWRGRARGGAK